MKSNTALVLNEQSSSIITSSPWRRTWQATLSRKIPLLVTSAYLIILLGISWHLYRNPEYSMDSIQYMGNALLINDSDIFEIHSKVYVEVRKWVPQPARDQLLGKEAGAPSDQDQSRQLRAKDAHAFAEFLPFCAIRPLYILVVNLVSHTRLGLLRSTLFISAAAYFLMGYLLLIWLKSYASLSMAAILATLTMISPPLILLGRRNTSDALATLVAFYSLYLIFETPSLTAGFIVLLASIYFRTDFVVLAGPVILACWIQHRIKLWHGAVLSLLAVGSVLLINHFAGDYGFRMLYYRNFIGTPLVPAETTVTFTLRDYISAFRSGVTLLATSFFIPFLFAGIAVFWTSSRVRTIAAVAICYSLLHFVVLPNWEERWFGLFYLSMAIGASAVLPNNRTSLQERSPCATPSRLVA